MGQGSEFTFKILTPIPTDEDADARGRELPRAGVLRQAQQTRCRAKSLEVEVRRWGGKGCPPDHLCPSGRAQDQALDVQGELAEAGTHAKTAEQGPQAAKQTLGGLEATVQEAIPHHTL